MKKAALLFMLFILFQWNSIAQEEIATTASEIPIKKLEHSDVMIQNTFRINTPNLEFSPSYYQNGIVYVRTYDKSEKIDANIGIPFFELFYAELDGEGMPSNPQPFSAKVNSVTHEGPTTFNSTEDVIYYTSNSDKKSSEGKHTMNIYEARRGAEDWENSIEMPFNSNEYYTMHPTISENGSTLYFASSMPGGYGGTDIYSVEKEGDTWGIPMNLGPNVNTEKNEAFPFIHQSGILFFSSEGHEGIGGYDIFAINTLEEEVKEIYHLGAPFNTPNADLGLILNPTGTQGYFASSRYGGLGQDDIYLFNAPNGLFGNVAQTAISANILVVKENDGNPIPDAGVYLFEKNKSGLFGEEDLYEVVLEAKEANSEEMEVRFVMKKDLGKPQYYTNSQGLIAADMAPNREYLILVTKKGYANKELRYPATDQLSPLTIRIPLSTKDCATVSGLVLNEDTGEALPNAKISIQSTCDNSIQHLTTDNNGYFEQCLPFGCQYNLTTIKSGYDIGKGLISTVNLTQSTIKTNIRLNPLESSSLINTDNLTEGSTIILENIYYDFNKSAIRSGAAEELDALVTLMRQYPSMEVELLAHTDARGDAVYNQNLSQARALAAKNYLERKGITGSRIIATGKGETEIRNHCTNGVKCADDNHQYNRRTEVKVTKLSENVGVRYSGK